MMMFIDVSLTGYYFPCVVLKWKVSFLIKVLAYHVYIPMKYHWTILHSHFKFNLFSQVH